MKPIVTLTLNPAIDSACQADEVRPILKIRTTDERYDPGGGGINVARVIRELGGETIAVYLAGGLTGQAFNHMIDAIGLQSRVIPIAGDTRVSHVVYERSSGQEYRFVPSGPHIHEDEWQACLEAIAALDADYVVASGSLPRGLPEDFYARLARVVADKGHAWRSTRRVRRWAPPSSRGCSWSSPTCASSRPCWAAPCASPPSRMRRRAS